MSTRWLIRLVVLVSVLLLGAMADAQQTRGGASPAPAPAPGGGSAPTGGGARAPAPKPAPAPAPTPAPAPARDSGNSGTSSGSGSGTTTPPTNTGSAGGVTTGTGAPISGTPAPVTRTPGPSMGRPATRPTPTPPPGSTDAQGADQTRGRRHRPNPNSPSNPPTIILPQQYGWAPYTWWYNGNNYWMPPAWNNGYYGNGYPGDGYRAADDYNNDNRYDRVASPPTPPTPSPTQEQARAANALQGSSAYTQAMADFKAAQAAYDDAVARVMDRLRRDPEYQRLVAQRERADERVGAVQAGARIEPNPDRVLPAAQQKLQISSKVTKMEQDAIAADPQASAAKAKLVEANERLTALRKQGEVGGGTPAR